MLRLLLSAALLPPATAGSCALLGACRTPGLPLTARSVNCANPPDTTPLLPPSFQLSTCPEYQDAACCDETQHQILTSSLSAAQELFGRCPACTESFRRAWCAFSCSPNQSDFVSVLSSSTYDDTFMPGALVADSASFNLSAPFAQGWFDACAGVQFGGTGQTVLQMLGLDRGGPRAFLHFQGLVAPEGSSPFSIDMRITPDEGNASAAFTPQPVGCDDPSFSCGPSDCEALRDKVACPLRPPSTPAHLTVEQLTGVRSSDGEFVTAALLAGLTLAIGIVLGVLRCTVPPSSPPQSKPAEDEPLTPPSSPRNGGGGGILSPVDDHTSIPPSSIAGLEDERPHPSPSPACVSTATALAAPEQLFPAPRASRLWSALGHGVARAPRSLLLAAASIGIACLVLGSLKLRLDTKPEELWVAPRSRGALEAGQHAQQFGPPPRITQLIATPRAGGRALTTANLMALLALQRRIAGAVGEIGGGRRVTLPDVCYTLPAPPPANTSSPGSNGCVVESATGWFQDSAANILSPPSPGPSTPAGSLEIWLHGSGEDWPGCLSAPYDPRCLSSHGLPQQPSVVLGGYGGGGSEADRAWNATQLVVTWLVRGVEEGGDDAPQRAWEAAAMRELKASARDQAHPFTLAYSTQRSLQDELSRETRADAPSVALAYTAMLLYVAFALPMAPGGPRAARTLLALASVVLVGLSLSVAAALGAAAGWHGSLIAVEVAPFLLLAVGVDTAFFIAAAWADTRAPSPDAEHARAMLPHRAAATLSACAGAVSAAAASETLALIGAGALAQMPAVRSFCWLAAAAIAADWALQLTCFTALLVLMEPWAERRRVAAAAAALASAARPGSVVAIAVTAPSPNPLDEALLDSPGEDETAGGPAEEATAEVQFSASAASAAASAAEEEAQLRRPPSVFARWLLGGWVSGLILFFAAFGTAAALISLPSILPLGLDQSSALPGNSYLRSYFSALAGQLEVGPPLEWTLATQTQPQLQPLPLWDVRLQDSLLTLPCATNWSSPAWAAPPPLQQRCPQQPSLLAQLGACGRSLAGGECHLAGSPSDFLTDALRWMDPGSGLCLTTIDAAATTPGVVPPPCDPTTDPSLCAPCPFTAQGEADGVDADAAPSRPTRETFLSLLPRFLASECSAAKGVSLCGAPHRLSLDCAYVSEALSAAVAGGAVPSTLPSAVLFRGWFSPLRTQSDFIGAHGAARLLADNLNSPLAQEGHPSLRLSATSPFIIFFEQYSGLRFRAALAAAAACAAALLCCAAAMGSFSAAAAVAAVVAGVAVQTAALSHAVCGLQMNALLLANLAAAAGLAAEFAVHIAARSARAQRCGLGSLAAARAGLDGAGGLVAKGVAATKLLGVSCLAFSATQIFRQYYFCGYAITLMLCTLNSLLVLPCLLAALMPEHAPPPRPEPSSHRHLQRPRPRLWAALRSAARREAARQEAEEDAERATYEALREAADESGRL